MFQARPITPGLDFLVLWLKSASQIYLNFAKFFLCITLLDISGGLSKSKITSQ